MEIIVWLVLVPLGLVGIVAWIYRIPDRGAIPHALRVGWNRAWGTHHQLRQGKLWEQGEHEVLRAQLLGVTAHTVDRHMQMQARTVCLVTNRRLVLCDDEGRSLRLLGSDIRTVRVHRTYDSVEGFSYAVVLERVGSTVHEPEGDLRLLCASQEQSRGLASAIEDLRTVVPL